MIARADVVVVGAGAMGSATAWWLARRGHDVVLLEQFEAGHRRGSSHGGTRIFRHAYLDAHYVRLAKQALPLWRELEADAGQSLLELTGALDHGDAATIEQVAAGLIGEQVAHEVLRTDQAAERWPGIRFDEAVLFHPEGGRCFADATVAACQQRAAAHGADVRFGVGRATVERSPSGDAAIVRAGDDTWEAKVAVVTAGGWAASTAGGLVDLPPLDVTLEQVQHFAPLDPSSEWPSFIHYADRDSLAMYSLATPGEGVKVNEYHVGPSIDPDDERTEDPARRAAVVEYVKEWVPGLDPTPINTATCLHTMTPNEDFVIDRLGPIVVGSPCSGHGFKFVPVIGRMLADLADGTATHPDPRFALPQG